MIDRTQYTFRIGNLRVFQTHRNGIVIVEHVNSKMRWTFMRWYEAKAFALECYPLGHR